MVEMKPCKHQALGCQPQSMPLLWWISIVVTSFDLGGMLLFICIALYFHIRDLTQTLKSRVLTLKLRHIPLRLSYSLIHLSISWSKWRNKGAKTDRFLNLVSLAPASYVSGRGFSEEHTLSKKL
jgi:hypothetical protein